MLEFALNLDFSPHGVVSQFLVNQNQIITK